MSGAPPVAAPPVEPIPGNLGCLFAPFAQEDRPAIVDLRDFSRPVTVTYRELDAACDAVANGLVRAGCRRGDRVAILARNRVEYAEILFGAMRAGVVPVPINVKLAPDTVRVIVEDAGAKLLFAETAFARLCPRDARTVFFDAEGEGGFAAFLAPGPFAAFEPGPRDVAIQPYTSGSTGRPKGVLLTHWGQNWARRTLVHYRGTTPRDVFLIAAPLYHKNALLAMKQSLTAGALVPLLPQFDLESYLGAIGRYRATVISGVPTMIALMLGREDLLACTDMSSVKLISIGSAPASDALLKQIGERLPGARVMLNYGVTEGGPVPFGPHVEGKARPHGSVGFPWPGTEVRLEGGATPNEGELWLRNPGILAGYHNLPEETAKRIVDGWYRTGDVFRRDAEGFMFFVGRVDDMFVCGGENIFPAEVEEVIERLPQVAQCVVVPADHHLKGQVPHAFVVLRPGASLDEAAVKAHALANAPPYMHPRRVYFVDELPLSSTNKIDRRLLRERANASAAAAAGE